MNLEAHEYANWFPMLSESELLELADDIERNGQLEPIMLLDGKVLDGRNRLAACQLVDVEPRTTTYNGADPQAYVVSQNLCRRHLSESQRAMVAAKLANLSNGQRASSIDGAKTQTEAANLLNVGTKSVERAKAVQRDGVPEVVDKVNNGDMSVYEAEQVSQLSPEKQKDLAAIESKQQRQQAFQSLSKKEAKDAARHNRIAAFRTWACAIEDLRQITATKGQRERTSRLLKSHRHEFDEAAISVGYKKPHRLIETLQQLHADIPKLIQAIEE